MCAAMNFHVFSGKYSANTHERRKEKVTVLMTGLDVLNI